MFMNISKYINEINVYYYLTIVLSYIFSIITIKYKLRRRGSYFWLTL